MTAPAKTAPEPAMGVPTKIAVFVVGLVVIFGIAAGVGNAVGAIGDSADDRASGMNHGGDSAASPANEELPGGLMTSQDGYSLRLASTRAAAGADQKISFTIDGPDGKPVTDYDVEHEKELHLIVVRRDFTGFQHVHPVRAADGTWSIDVDLTAGQWRVFADFKPAGAEALTLGADLSVPGAVAAAPELPEVRTAEVDGYTVTVEGDLVAGDHSMLKLSVAKDGKPVTDLQPYLGAYGHLVALREGDLAYLHVHPGGEPGDGKTEPGPEIEFGAEVPSANRYHLYLDFKHNGVVRTAQLALDAADTTGAPVEKDAEHEEDGEHGH